MSPDAYDLPPIDETPSMELGRVAHASAAESLAYTSIQSADYSELEQKLVETAAKSEGKSFAGIDYELDVKFRPDAPNSTIGVDFAADGKPIIVVHADTHIGKHLSEQQLAHLKQIISTMKADSASFDRERHIEKVRKAIAAKGFKRAIGEMFDQRERKQLAIKVYHNPAPAPLVVALNKAARYKPCPCGSGKKLKFCCGGGR